MRTLLFFENIFEFDIPKCTPRELYTWMLGKILVFVSELYSQSTRWVKTLSLGKTEGRRLQPFG